MVLVIAAIGFAGPLLASSIACEEDGGSDCCGMDCALCLCCSHSPRTALSEVDRGSGRGPVGKLGPEECPVPREPLPQDVLHVPKIALAR